MRPDRLGAMPPLRVALLALLWLMLLAWARPLMLPDEGRYVGVAWEMVRSGHWLVPTLDGLPYFHKPPLFYWITAASLKLFGVWEWPARLASLLGAWFGAMAVFLLVRRWWSAQSAGLALATLLVLPMFYLGAQFANLDMLVAGCITTTIVLLAHAVLAMERDQPHRTALLGAYAAAALGVLAKGLIGFVLPALVIGVWLLLERRWRSLFKLVSLPGVVLFLLLAAPWFGAMQARYPDFLNYFFVVQHFKRFAAGGFNNVQPFWFYPVVLALAALPWLSWLVPQFARDRLRDPARGPLRRLLWVWLVVIVGFFSLPASKLLGYALPVVPPLAVLLADGFEARHANGTGSMRGWWWAAVISMALNLAAIGVLAVRTPHSSRALAAVLRVQRQPTEPVYWLDNDYFDLPIYARLETPVNIVLDWKDPALHHRDTWRKEVADAATFAPDMATARLLQPERLAPSLCRQSVVWLVGPLDMAARYPFLSAGKLAASNKEARLWRLDARELPVRRALGCPGTPTRG